MKKPFALFLFLCAIVPFCSFSQELKGDIIWVNAATNATIKFPEDIISVDPGCAPGLYLLTITGNKLVVSPVAEKKPPSCVIAVEEGEGKTTRHHTFTVYFQSDDADIDLHKSYVDIHNMDLLQKRISELESSKPPTQEQTKTAPAPVSAPVENTQLAVTPPPTAPPPALQARPEVGTPAGTDDIDFGSTKVSRTQLNERVTRKLEVFRQNLEILGTHRGGVPSQKVIENIMKFFNNDQAVKVEVRNGNKAPVTKLILQYLNDFSHSPYSSVKVEYSQLKFIGQFEKNPDGTYRGIVSLEQTFTGMREGKPQYRDVTKKNVSITVRITDLVKDGETKQFIEVFLGDITLAKEG